MSLLTDDFKPDEPSTELVHWMEPGQFRVGRVGVAAAVAAGFGLGVAAVIAGIAGYRWLAPRREGLPPWRWGRGPLH